MGLNKYKLLIAGIFLWIFAIKMLISGAPVFFKHFDGEFMISVIMQLENETHGEENGKSGTKYTDHKLALHKYDYSHVDLDINKGVPNSFIEHSRRYVDPYHPSVPTPPPNLT